MVLTELGCAGTPELRAWWLSVLTDVADVLVHVDDPLASRESVTPADLMNHPWVSTPEGTICHEWFSHMFAATPHAPRVGFRCVEFASQVELVAHGLAVALVPRLGRGHLPSTVVAVPVLDPMATAAAVARMVMPAATAPN